ncbi:MAG: putative nucleotidyltransferase substrate binding domain-containing protein [Halothiobacillaceae bacterium]
MAAELWEIRAFLSEVALFSDLPEEALDRLPERLKVRYFRRGSPFPPADAPGLWLLRSGALLRRDPEDGSVIEQLGTRDYWLLRADQTHETGWEVREDSLLYRLPADGLERLGSRHPALALKLERDARQRLEQALLRLRSESPQALATMSARVDGLLAREPVTGHPDMSIREVAQRMSECRVTSLPLLKDGQLCGLVTDRDLRRRCLAAGRAPEEPVHTIMTRELVTISPSRSAFEAMLLLSRHTIHHLPVVDESGRLLGILSSSDLLRSQGTQSVHLVREIRAAETTEAVIEAGRRLPVLQTRLVDIGADGPVLGEAMVTVTDAMTRRLIELAGAELGPAPVQFAWVAVGSQGRREQTAHSDQDHALILADDYDPTRHARWFADLADRVRDGLASAGLVTCPGDVMASNPQWRLSLADWTDRFATWIDSPDPKAMMLACNFFDMRTVHGANALRDALFETILPTAAQNGIFHRFLAADALSSRPPLGFFGQLVVVSEDKHEPSVDLKHQGLLPIVDLARWHAVSAGLHQVNTLERLEAAAGHEMLAEDTARALMDAWRFLYTLRARHQAAQIRAGTAPDNRLAPDTLSGLEREHLRDAFRVIADHQKWLRRQLDVASLGTEAG